MGIFNGNSSSPNDNSQNDVPPVYPKLCLASSSSIKASTSKLHNRTTPPAPHNVKRRILVQSIGRDRVIWKLKKIWAKPNRGGFGWCKLNEPFFFFFLTYTKFDDKHKHFSESPDQLYLTILLIKFFFHPLKQL